MIATRNRHGSAVVTLPSDVSIQIVRAFDAPAAAVWKAYTTPELVKRWWGFDSSQWVECTIDLRVGGRWRYHTREEGGIDVGFHGEYQEIAPPTRLVSTEVFEGYPDAAAVDTLVLTEKDGVTTLTITVLHTSQEHRDGHINSGMERGMQISMNRLEDLAKQLSAT